MDLARAPEQAGRLLRPREPGRLRVLELRHGVPGRDTRFVGNFNGFNIYDISDPASADAARPPWSAPAGRATCRCTSNLLFMSVEETRAKIDCSSTPAADRDHAIPRRAHLRHQQPGRRPCRWRACRPAVARTRTRSSPTSTIDETSTSTCRAPRASAPPEELAGCDGNSTNPPTGDEPVEVADRGHQGAARGAAGRRRRQHAAAVRGSGDRRGQRTPERAPDAAAPVRDGLGPDADHRRLPRHHRVSGDRARDRGVRGQRPADRHQRPGQADGGSTRSRTRCTRTGTVPRSATTARRSCSPTSGAAARARALPRPPGRRPQVGWQRDLRDRPREAAVPQLLQDPDGADQCRRTASATSRRWCRCPAATSSSRPGTRAARRWWTSATRRNPVEIGYYDRGPISAAIARDRRPVVDLLVQRQRPTARSSRAGSTCGA